MTPRPHEVTSDFLARDVSGAELGDGAMLARRLLRPQTYYRAAHALFDRRKWNIYDQLVSHAIEASPEEFTFVQIGANDGVRNDPFRRHLLRNPQIRGLMIEPVPWFYDQLVDNTKQFPNVTRDKVAVGIGAGEIAMTAVHPDSRLRGSSRLATKRDSLAPDTWTVRDADRVTHEIVVPVLTLPELLGKHAIERVDLLIIDAEGSDKDILDQFEPDEYHASMMLYEHNSLTRDEQNDLRYHFQEMGFAQYRMRRDTFMFRASTFDFQG